MTPPTFDRKPHLEAISREEGLSLREVAEIVDSQFAFVARTMKEATPSSFPAIRLPYFGLFHARKGRIAYIQECSKKKRGED